jgi:hypothetical protein
MKGVPRRTKSDVGGLTHLNDNLRRVNDLAGERVILQLAPGAGADRTERGSFVRYP